MRISTNVLSQQAQHRMQKLTAEDEKTNFKLSSGDRIFQAAYDPAGLAISEGLKAKVRSSFQAQRNANDSISLLQVAEGVLGSIQGIGGRLRELAIQSATDTVSDTDRGVINVEYQALKHEIQRIIASAKYNGRNLLNGEGSVYTFQIGVKGQEGVDHISYDMKNILTSIKKWGINDTTITSKFSARSAITDVDNFITQISGQRADLGSIQNRLTSTIENLQVSNENTARANSVIRDADMAVETTNKAKNTIIQNATSALMTKVVNNPKYVLKLIS